MTALVRDMLWKWPLLSVAVSIPGTMLGLAAFLGRRRAVPYFRRALLNTAGACTVLSMGANAGDALDSFHAHAGVVVVWINAAAVTLGPALVAAFFLAAAAAVLTVRDFACIHRHSRKVGGG